MNQTIYTPSFILNPHQLRFVTRVSVGYLPSLPLRRKPLRLSPLPLQRFPKPDIWQVIQVYLTKSSDPTITGITPVGRVSYTGALPPTSSLEDLGLFQPIQSIDCGYFIAPFYDSLFNQFDIVCYHIVMGVEPMTSAWKADVLPLNYSRTLIYG